MYPKTISTSTLIFIFLLFTSFSFAQTKKINGQVMFHSSKSESGKIKFVEGVKIKPLNSDREVYSDSKGQFKIKLKGKFEGEPILIQVEKEGYEVVDYRDIHYFLVDKKPRLKIFLVERGYVKNVLNTLSMLGKQSLTREKEELLELLAFGGAATTDAVRKIENRLGQNLQNAHDAEQLIPKLEQQILKLVRLHSHELAVVNPDFSSDKYQMALSAYRSGNHERAIEKLQKENVDEELEELYAEVHKLEKTPRKIDALIIEKNLRLDQIKNNYIFQIVALQQSFRLKEASETIEKLTKLNHLAPNQKYFDIIKKLDFFEVSEIIDNRKPIVSRNKIPSNITARFNSQNKIRNPKVTAPKNQKNSIQAKENSVHPRENLVQSNDKVSNIPTPYAINNIASKKENAPASNSKVVQNIGTKSADKVLDRNINSHINTNNSNNQETTITITTTITTSTNGNTQVKTMANDSNQLTESNQLINPTELNESTSTQPTEYFTKVEKANASTDELRNKGEAVLSIENATYLDFENVLLSSKTLNAHFKYFFKNGKKVKREVE